MIYIKDNKIYISGNHKEDLHRNFVAYLNKRTYTPQLIGIEIESDSKDQTTFFSAPFIAETPFEIINNLKQLGLAVDRGEDLAIVSHDGYKGKLSSEDLDEVNCSIFNHHYLLTSTGDISLKAYFRYTYGFKSEEDNKSFLLSKGIPLNNLLVISSNHSSSIEFKVREIAISSQDFADVFTINLDKNSSLIETLAGFKDYLAELLEEVSS